MAASGTREQCEVNSDRNLIEFSWHFNKILVCRSVIVHFFHFPCFSLDIHVIHENIHVQTTSPQKKHGCPLIHLLFRVAHGQEQSSYDIELYLSISISVFISIYCLKSLKQLQFGPFQEEEKVADLAHKIWGKTHAAIKIEMSPN